MCVFMLLLLLLLLHVLLELKFSNNAVASCSHLLVLVFKLGVIGDGMGIRYQQVVEAHDVRAAAVVLERGGVPVRDRLVKVVLLGHHLPEPSVQVAARAV